MVENAKKIGSVMFYSLAVLDPRVAKSWTYFLHWSLSSVILIDSSGSSLEKEIMQGTMPGRLLQHPARR